MNAFVNWKTVAGVALAAAAATGCGDAALQGNGASYLIIDSLQGRAGGISIKAAANPLPSDVLTNVTSPAPCTTTAPCPTIFADAGQVTLRLLPKDVSSQPLSPSAMDVTINRYHVHYFRADGRNTPGQDVPYDFDGTVTFTIPTSGTASFGFELVRSAAKSESPLVQLVSNPNVISTIAEVTFYGHDVAGNSISVTGSLLIDFANFGDS